MLALTPLAVPTSWGVFSTLQARDQYLSTSGRAEVRGRRIGAYALMRLLLGRDWLGRDWLDCGWLGCGLLGRRSRALFQLQLLLFGALLLHLQALGLLGGLGSIALVALEFVVGFTRHDGPFCGYGLWLGRQTSLRTGPMPGLSASHGADAG